MGGIEGMVTILRDYYESQRQMMNPEQAEELRKVAYHPQVKTEAEGLALIEELRKKVIEFGLDKKTE